MARILMATIGSLGDLHPFLAIGRELQALGHEVTVATSDKHGPRIEEAGMKFAEIPPKFPEESEQNRVMERFMDPRHGSDRVMTELIAPCAADTLRTIEPLVHDADILVLHPFVVSAAYLAEKVGKPWVALPYAPMMFATIEEPPIVHDMRRPERLKWIGNWPLSWIMKFALAANRKNWQVFLDIRKQLGLPPAPGHPFFDHYLKKADMVVACFSESLGKPLAEWPKTTVQTGFAFFDSNDAVYGKELNAELNDFLASGDPPVVVTLGSTGVYTAGTFYRDAWAAVQKIGRRAVLLTGPETETLRQEIVDPDCLILNYVPHTAIFPRGCVNIHHGGLNTTGQALRAGVPQLVVPMSHDQFDNAARIVRAGRGLSLPKAEFTVERAVPLLSRLVDDPSFREHAAAGAEIVAGEPGARGAAEAIDELYRRLASGLEIAGSKGGNA